MQVDSIKKAIETNFGMRRRIALGALAMMGYSAATFAANPADGAKRGKEDIQPTVVTVQYYPGIFVDWAAQITQYSGIAARNGLEFKFVAVGGGPTATAGLVSGSYDLGLLDLSLTGGLLKPGSVPVKMIMGSELAPWALMASKKAADLAAVAPEQVAQKLAGKEVGVIALGSSSYFYMRGLLKASGVPVESVKIAAAGGFPQLVAALRNGVTYVAMEGLDTMYAMVHQDGLKVLLNFAEKPKDDSFKNAPIFRGILGVPTGGLWARTEWITKNGELIKRIQRAIAQGTVFAKDPKNIGKLSELMGAHGMIPKDIKKDNELDYISSTMKYVAPYFSHEDADAQMKFWVDMGLVKKYLPPNDWMVPGIPTDMNALRQLAIDEPAH